MRKHKLFIIKPTKARNPFINNVEIPSFVFHMSQESSPSLILTSPSQNTSKMEQYCRFRMSRDLPRDLGRVPSRACPFLAETQNYKVVFPSVGFPEHLESHQSEFGRVRYAQNATVAQSSKKSFFCSFSSESVPNSFLSILARF